MVIKLGGGGIGKRAVLSRRCCAEDTAQLEGSNPSPPATWKIKFDIEPGYMVKWFEEYADGIVKDGGVGLVIEKKLGRFLILRSKYGDTMWFEMRNVEHLGSK